jgi:hypothetical protein
MQMNLIGNIVSALDFSRVQLDYVDFSSFLQLVVFMQNIGGFLF